MHFSASPQFYLCLSALSGKDQKTLRTNLVKANAFIVSEKLAILASEADGPTLLNSLGAGVTNIGQLTILELSGARIVGTGGKDLLNQVFSGGLETVFDKPAGKLSKPPQKERTKGDKAVGSRSMYRK